MQSLVFGKSCLLGVSDCNPICPGKQLPKNSESASGTHNGIIFPTGKFGVLDSVSRCGVGKAGLSKDSLLFHVVVLAWSLPSLLSGKHFGKMLNKEAPLLDCFSELPAKGDFMQLVDEKATYSHCEAYAQVVGSIAFEKVGRELRIKADPDFQGIEVIA